MEYSNKFGHYNSVFGKQIYHFWTLKKKNAFKPLLNLKQHYNLKVTKIKEMCFWELTKMLLKEAEILRKRVPNSAGWKW
jgi:hypothetical protein